MNWDAASIPDLSGKTAIVTGASSGVGAATARLLAANNAEVILAVRDVAKGQKVAESLAWCAGSGSISVELLELGSLASVKAFAERMLASRGRLDLLVNNAGVMAPPYGKTEDGFELQFGINHLGHFALSLRLLALLEATPGARLVAISSVAHRNGRLDFSDLHWEKRKYKAFQAYCDSKLANLLFVDVLVRRLNERGNQLCVTAAHPGWTSSDLARHRGIFSRIHPLLAQSTEQGALPSLRAACDPAARPGNYFGPGGFREMRGLPVNVKSKAAAKGREVADKLWQASENLTGVYLDSAY